MDHPVLTVEVAQLFAEQLILSHAGGRPRAALLLAAMNLPHSTKSAYGLSKRNELDTHTTRMNPSCSRSNPPVSFSVMTHDGV